MTSRKIIVKNKRNNKEKLELTIDEFKTKFKIELNSAFNSYKRLCEYKKSLLPPFMHKNVDYKSEFYYRLRENFNLNSNSVWYIDKII